MSRKQSGVMQMIDERCRVAHRAAKSTYSQYLTDTACIALNNLGWGETRIRRFLVEWGKAYDEFFTAMQPDPEADYMRTKMDERLRPLCKQEAFDEFEKRYGYLPEMKY